MTYNYPALDIIDAQIAKAQDRITAAGTVTSVTSITRAMVVFDGSAVAVPVKVWTNVPLAPDARVGLIRFGSDWVVIGSNTAPAAVVRPLASVSVGSTIAVSGTTTSGTLTAMPGSPAVVIDKVYDDSLLLVFVAATFYATIANTFGSLGCKVDGPSASGVTSNVGALFFNAANTNMHCQIAGVCSPGGAGWVAGTYTITAAWGRAAGTGTLTQDTNDWVSLMVEEIAP